jgi:hypothetical protein
VRLARRGRDLAAGERGKSVARAPSASQDRGPGWLDALPDAGARQVFAPLDAHGNITEDEVARMLGGARAMRRFSLAFDDLARRAPFEVRIETVGGVKRYVRDGGGR